jgi:uncharacterized NAD(P)/FAD-binding protein YdhS
MAFEGGREAGVLRTVAVVGGGLAGTVFALKLARARADLKIVLIDQARRPGRGLAYGACAPRHLLNVPVSRMETGLEPRFVDWLQAHAETFQTALDAALAESGGDLSMAFVPRALFGAYLENRLAAARQTDAPTGVHVLRGRAVAALDGGRRGVRLEDGRVVEAGVVVLALGNLPPAAPGRIDAWLYDTPWFTPDPWAAEAFDDLDPAAPVLLVGAGLTMVDVALLLEERGHRGPMLAVSRHGLLPRSHQAGGGWPSFLAAHVGESPLELLRRVRTAVAAAAAEGVPWQRVFDAARPAVGALWSRWSLRQRRQFLRHLRARWDIHRHRTAPRVDAALQALIHRGQLRIQAARLAGFEVEDERVAARLALRGGGEAVFEAGRVVNCTGPASALDRLALPLVESLRAQGLVKPDPLGLGLESSDCALMTQDGAVSAWLFALGGLTRPAWWEITATPEILVQIDRLVERMADGDLGAARAPAGDPAAAFLDLGAGI